MGASDGQPACQRTYHDACRECGLPIVDDKEYLDHGGLCVTCLYKGRPSDDRHDLLTLLTSLRLDRDAVPLEFAIWPGEMLDERWAGFRVEWALIPDIVWRHPTLVHQIYHPWRVRLPGSDVVHIILRWRAWRPGAQGFLEMYFEGERSAIPTTFRLSLRDFDANATESALKHFADLARTHGLSGRPARSGMLLPDQTFRTAFFLACDAVEQRSLKQPRQIDVAKELKEKPSVDTLHRRLRDIGLPDWRDALAAWRQWRTDSMHNGR